MPKLNADKCEKFAWKKSKSVIQSWSAEIEWSGIPTANNNNDVLVVVFVVVVDDDTDIFCLKKHNTPAKQHINIAKEVYDCEEEKLLNPLRRFTLARIHTFIALDCYVDVLLRENWVRSSARRLPEERNMNNFFLLAT